jgi:endonuclease/exonuclease/phosphatase family metal-dependent hydrolase
MLFSRRAAANRRRPSLHLNCERLEDRSLPSVVQPGAALISTPAGHQDAASTGKIRIVTYNIEDDINGATTPLPGLYPVLEGIGEEEVQGSYQPLDILALQETTSNVTTVAPIVSTLNTFYSGIADYAQSTYQATQSGGNTDGNGPNALIYNTTTLNLLASVGVGTPKGSSNGEYRQVVRYEFQPVGDTGSTGIFYVYVSHSKSGSTTTDSNDRNEEAQIVRNDEATLPASAAVLYVGDLNLNASTDASYQTLAAASSPSGVGQGAGFDPINKPGNWALNSAFQGILTESATDLRYRDDLELVTQNVLDDTAGNIGYVSGSYHTFGNNGTTPIQGSVDSGSDTALNNDLVQDGPLFISAATLYADLTTASDHLPVVADYTVPPPPPPPRLLVSGFTPTPSGFVVNFNKPFNPGSVVMYTSGSIPDDVMLTGAGSQVSVRGTVLTNSANTSLTFVKTDSINAFGTFNPANGLLAAGKYTLTLRSLSAGNGFEDTLGIPLDGTDTGDPNDNYVISFSVSAPPVAVGIPDFARGPSNTDALFLPDTLTNGNTFALTYTNPAANPAMGTATITFSTTPAILQANIQSALSFGGLATQIGVNSSAGGTPNSVVIVTNDVSSGANFLVTFQSALAQATNQLLNSTTPGVSISAATINVANNVPGNGIPVALSSGLGVTSGAFTLQYNPSLLTISGGVSAIAGATFTVNTAIVNSTSATAVLSFSSPTAVSTTTTPITVGSLLATVPMTAAASYGAMQLLHFGSVQLNGTAGPITATNADAIEVAAYFGDVTDSGGPLSLSDAAAVSAIAKAVTNSTAQTIPGFAAFPTLDPAIIGDVSLQGSVNSTDAGAMLQEVGGLARITIPHAPIGLSVTLAVVADENLSADLSATTFSNAAYVTLGTDGTWPSSFVASQARKHAPSIVLEDVGLVAGTDVAVVDVSLGVVEVMPGFGVDAANGTNHLGRKKDVFFGNDLQQ